MRTLILFFTSCLYYCLISTAPQKLPSSKFPLPLPDLPPYEYATPAFAFDGIDYNELPEKLRETHNDCLGHWLRCIRNRTAFNYACSFRLKTYTDGYWGYYYSQCEIELQNCQNRLAWGHGLYGTDYKNDYIFFSGEGRWCEMNVRKEDPNHKFD